MKRTAQTTTRTTAQRIVQTTVLTTGQTAQTAGILQAARIAQITTRTTARRIQAATQATIPATAQVRIPAKILQRMQTILTTAQSSLQQRSGRHHLGTAWFTQRRSRFTYSCHIM